MRIQAANLAGCASVFVRLHFVACVGQHRPQDKRGWGKGSGTLGTVRGGYLCGLLQGYSVSTPSPPFSMSQASLRPEVTQTPGWLTGASMAASPRPRLRNFAGREQHQADTQTPALLHFLHREGRSQRRSRQRLRFRPMRNGGRVGAFAHWVSLVPPAVNAHHTAGY